MDVYVLASWLVARQDTNDKTFFRLCWTYQQAEVKSDCCRASWRRCTCFSYMHVNAEMHLFDPIQQQLHTCS